VTVRAETAPVAAGGVPPTARTWARRAAALAVLIAAAAIAWWGMRLPLAAPVSGSQSWTINAGDQVTLIDPSPGRVLSFAGAVGKGVGVRFARATLSPDTADGLAALGVPPFSPQAQPVQWITHDGGDSRASVAVDLERAGPHPALVVQLTSGDGVAEVAFRAQDAKLRVTMAGPLVGPATPDADVVVGSSPIKIGQGAFPISVDAPPGQMFTLRFAQSTAGGARFDWGQVVNPLQRLTVLNVAGVRVQRPGETDPIYACGSQPEAVAWRSIDVAKLACQPTLRLQGLDLAPEGGSFKIAGSAFLLQRGEAVTLSWDKVKANPLISSLGGVAYSGLIGWIIRGLWGRSGKAAA
jgi:hypothetical protein